MRKLTLEQMYKIINDAPMDARCYLLKEATKPVSYSDMTATSSTMWTSLQALQSEINTREKVNAIVEAVNYYADGQFKCAGYVAEGINTQATTTFNNKPSEHLFNIICKNNEYNQCIKEMSEAAWMNQDELGEPQSYEAHKQAVKDMEEDDKAAGYILTSGDLMSHLRRFESGVTFYTKKNHVEYVKINKASDIARYIFRLFTLQESQEVKAAKEREEKAKALFELACNNLWGRSSDQSKESFCKLVDAGAQIPKGY
jgi:hypothetical protein